MSIYFVKHGRTASGGTGLLGGDESLVAQGLDDARLLATELERILHATSLAHVITSPRKRCLETAEVIANILQYDLSKIETDDRLAERDVETYIGQPIAKVFSQTEEALIAGGMEPLADLQERTAKLVSDVKRLTGDILLVGHSGNIRPLCEAFSVPLDTQSGVLQLA